MKKLKVAISIMALACCVMFLFCSNFFVKAQWIYSGSAPSNFDLDLDITVFQWKGSEGLPNDVQGENHRGLIDTILDGVIVDANGKTVEIGLNNPDSYISKEIETRSTNWLFSSKTLGSMDYWERNDIAEYFDLDTTGLTFLIYFPEGISDTYYLYTTSVELGDNTPNVPIGQNIYPIYQTVIEKNENGKWVATETKVGYAKSAYYSNPVTGSWLVKYPSFDPSTWFAGDLGTSFDDAVYTYAGETVTTYLTLPTDVRYYKLTATSNKNISISTENSYAKFNVYNSSGSLVSASKGAQGTSAITFKPSNNSVYYIGVSGDTSITFKTTQA